MMKFVTKRSLRFVFVGLALFAMLALAACEPVGGVNLNKLMSSSLEVKSSEGKASLSIEAIIDEASMAEAELSDEELLMVQILSGLKIEIDSFKQQDLSTMSMKGSIGAVDVLIPFAMSMNPSGIVIEVEGISYPLVIETDIDSLGLGLGMGNIEQLLADNQVDLAQAFLSYLMPNVPNPASIEVANTSIVINNEHVNVHKVSATIQLQELVPILGQIFHNIAQDEEGLRTFLSELYDIVKPLITELMELGLEEEMVEELFGDPMLQMALENKELAIEFLYAMLFEAIQEIAAGFEEESEMVDEFISEILSSDSYVAVELYVDSNLHVRKSVVEAVIIPSEPVDGFGGIKIHSEQEMWNINKDVTADVIDYDLYIDPEWEPVLPYVEGDSALGQLLTTFGLNEIVVEVMPASNAQDMTFAQRAYLDRGTTLVSAYWLAYQLDLETFYDDEEGYVYIYDPVTYDEIILVIGDLNAEMNQELISLPTAPVDHNGTPFVPLRAVAEQFDIEVIWDGDARTVILTKKYF